MTEKDRTICELKKENDVNVKVNKDLGEQLEIKKKIIDDFKGGRQKKELLEKNVEDLNVKLKELRNERDVLCAEIDELKRSRMYKQIYTTKKNLSEVTEKCDQMAQEINDERAKTSVLSQKVDRLKSKIKLEQSLKSEVKTQLSEQRSINAELNKILQYGKKKIALRDEESSHRYLDHVRQAYYYALQGEANVSATYCSKVLRL